MRALNALILLTMMSFVLTNGVHTAKAVESAAFDEMMIAARLAGLPDDSFCGDEPNEVHHHDCGDCHMAFDAPSPKSPEALSSQIARSTLLWTRHGQAQLAALRLWHPGLARGPPVI